MRSYPRGLIGRFFLLLVLSVCALPVAFGGLGAAGTGHAAVAAEATGTATATVTATASATATVTGTPVTISVAVNPSTIAAGGAVTVTGSGFRPGELIDIQLATGQPVSGIRHLAYVTAGANGDFSVANVAIPAGLAAGPYSIIAVGLASARSGQAALTVRAPAATVSVNPTTFSPTDTIAVSGTNFLPGEQVTISLATTSGSAAIPLGQVPADSSGNFGPANLRVPFGVPAGALQVVATGVTSNRQATANVTVQAPTPTVVVSPTSVNPTGTVAITGTHFQPGETVTIDLVTLAGTTRLGTATVDSTGGFTSSNLAIPQNTPEGTASVVITGVTSHLSATTQLKIGALPASVTVTPATVSPGGTVGISASGFIPGETVGIGLRGGPIAAFTLATVVVGTGGGVSIQNVTIPGFLPAGSYTLTIAGQTSGRSATTSLTVQAPRPAAPIISIISPTSANGNAPVLSPGGLLQVAGSNFPAGARITLALAGGSGAPVLTTITANDQGSFGPIGLTVPANVTPGSYTLQAIVNGTNVASVAVHIATLTPGVRVVSGTLAPGATLVLHGTGFAPGEQVVLALNGAALVTNPTTVLANASGAFTVTVIVPGTVTNGTNILTATGAISRVNSSINLQAGVAVTSRWYFAHGDTTAGNRTLIGLLNPNGTPAQVKMTFLYQAAPERSYSQTIPAHSQAQVDLALVAGIGRHVSTIVEADQAIGAESIVYYGGGDMSAALGASAPGTTWYLAEGYTGGTFREFLEIMNPNTSFANVDVRFLPFNGRPPREVRFSVPARSNLRIDAGQYMPAQSISAIVTADKGIVVERTMRFGLNRRGAHDKIGVATASTVWLFAQGNSNARRQTFLTILNPNPAAPAAITATFYDGRGQPVGTRTIVVDPLHRGNIKVNDILASAQVAVVVTSNVPVVVERPQYVGPANLALAPAGSDIFGRNGGGTSWMFPSAGAATGDQDQYFLFNPGLRPVEVTATFYTSTGAVLHQSLTLAPNSRSLLDATTVPGLPSGSFGVVLAGTGGVFVAEQSTLNSAGQRYSSTQGIAK